MKKSFHKTPHEIDNFYSSELRRVQRLKLIELRTQELRQERRQAVSHIKFLARELGQRFLGDPQVGATA